MKKKNIVIFNPDQFRAHALGHLGNKYSPTPNLDKFIKEAVSFRNAFTQAPVCTPSRTSFMTGLYPYTTGHRTMHSMIHPENGEKTLLHYLKESDYFVWWGGKNDLIHWGADWSKIVDVKVEQGAPQGAYGKLGQNIKEQAVKGDEKGFSFYAGELTPLVEGEGFKDNDWNNIHKGLDFLDGYKEEKPFAMFLPLSFPHPPYGVERPFYGSLDREGENLWPRIQGDLANKSEMLREIKRLQNLNMSEEAWHELRLTYLEQVKRVDHQFGMFVDKLKEKGVYDDTAIFFFSDHGDYTGDFGIAEKTQNTFEDSLANVPFLYKPPKDVPFKPGINEGLVELIDFFGTAVSFADKDVEIHEHFGKNLNEFINNPEKPIREYVVSAGGRLPDEEQASEFDSPGYANKDDPYHPRMKVQVDNARAHSKTIMLRDSEYKLIYRVSGENEFYDLKNDPQEKFNIYNNKDMKQIIDKYEGKLLHKVFETSDTVLKHTDSRTK